mmetsp:Transcript_105085/g.307073  ORF Transcript_105085/g.307073 Transcript_105085/m.307073 type:complete len:229 (-) Transcript_105085:465-1151(-)
MRWMSSRSKSSAKARGAPALRAQDWTWAFPWQTQASAEAAVAAIQVSSEAVRLVRASMPPASRSDWSSRSCTQSFCDTRERTSNKLTSSCIKGRFSSSLERWSNRTPRMQALAIALRSTASPLVSACCRACRSATATAPRVPSSALLATTNSGQRRQRRPSESASCSGCREDIRRGGSSSAACARTSSRMPSGRGVKSTQPLVPSDPSVFHQYRSARYPSPTSMLRRS